MCLDGGRVKDTAKNSLANKQAASSAPDSFNSRRLLFAPREESIDVRSILGNIQELIYFYN